MPCSALDMTKQTFKPVSWSLKMLQEAQRSLAPRAANASMSTLVWMFTWNEPFMMFMSSLVTV